MHDCRIDKNTRFGIDSARLSLKGVNQGGARCPEIPKSAVDTPLPVCDLHKPRHPHKLETSSLASLTWLRLAADLEQAQALLEATIDDETEPIRTG